MLAWIEMTQNDNDISLLFFLRDSASFGSFWFKTAQKSLPTMAPSLATTVAGIRLKTCVYNASGPRTGSSAALARITASESGAVLAKSATVDAQTGNPQPR